MKYKILLFLLISSCLIYTKVQAQWQMVYDSGSRGPRIFGDGNNVILRNDFGIALSKDSGNTWKQVETFKELQSSGGFIRKNSFLLVSTQYAIYKSQDSGQSWSFLSSWPTWGSFGAGFCLSSDYILSFSEYEKVIISKDNGFSWDSSNTGLPPTRISPMKVRTFYGFANSGNNVLAFYNGDLYISYNHGQSWHLKRKDLPFATSRLYSIGNKLFAGGLDLFISRDSGSTWDIVFTPKSRLNAVGGLRSYGKIIIAAVQNEGVIVSKDSGQNWVYMNKGLTTFDLNELTFTPGYVYCAAVQGKVFRRSFKELEGPEELVGIKEKDDKLNELLHLKVFPNPLKHSATIEFNKQLKNGLLIIYNIQGQEVRAIKNINTNYVTIQKEDLSSGTYIYSIKEGGQNLGYGQMIIE